MATELDRRITSIAIGFAEGFSQADKLINSLLVILLLLLCVWVLLGSILGANIMICEAISDREDWERWHFVLRNANDPSVECLFCQKTLVKEKVSTGVPARAP